MSPSPTSAGLLAALFLLAGPAPAMAQLALPNAAPVPAAGAAADLPAKPKPAKPTVKLDAKIDSILGKTLKLNGADGVLVINRRGEGLSVDKLVLKGESTKDVGAPCTIEVRGDAPMTLRPLGKIEGLQRFSIDFPACPVEFGLVDKAALVPAQDRACVFQAAACQASPAGLWGPDAASLGDGAKDIAAKRQRADVSLASALKSLLKRNKGKDAAAVSADEEAFAAQRGELCKNYDGEATLGFCASRLTMARAAKLAAELADKAAR